MWATRYGQRGWPMPPSTPSCSTNGKPNGAGSGPRPWPAVVKGTRVYVPLTVDHAVMSSVMKTHAFEGIDYEFVPAAEVIPYLAPHESRRLFGAAEIPGHHHDPDV